LLRTSRRQHYDDERHSITHRRGSSSKTHGNRASGATDFSMDMIRHSDQTGNERVVRTAGQRFGTGRRNGMD